MTHHTSVAIKQFSEWLKIKDEHLTEDINHYVHDEKNWLPTKLALNDFFNEVDALREATDRADAKVKYLSELLMNETTT